MPARRMVPVRKARFLGESSDMDNMAAPNGEIITVYGGFWRIELMESKVIWINRLLFGAVLVYSRGRTKEG